MHTFKFILKILAIIILIASITFNIFLWNSSNGSLVLKHNDDKLIAMASAQRIHFEPSYFATQKNSRTKITIKDKDSIETIYDINFDEKSIVTFSKTVKSNSSEKVSYYSNGILYTIENDVKTKEIYNPNNIYSEFLPVINVLQDALISDIETSSSKTKLYFEFWDIGIKYTVNDDEKSTKYIYSLDGNLKEISINYKNNKSSTYSIEHIEEELLLPDLTTF